MSCPLQSNVFRIRPSANSRHAIDSADVAVDEGARSAATDQARLDLVVLDHPAVTCFVACRR